MFKKLAVVAMATIVLLLTGCGNNQDSHLKEMKLDDMMSKMYAGFKEDELPKLANTEVTKENLGYYLGVESLDYEEAIASEPFIGSIPHSVVLVKMKDGSDIEKAKKDIKDKINPRKWICVEVEKNNVIVESRGNVIALIMDNDISKKISDNFKEI